MVHRFPLFEIDEPRRELRAGGTVLPVQPRVFDLLVYLSHHRDRAVPKDELLEAVWKDVMVAEGSLQRAVSLLRSALEKTGARNVIRTLPRHGYRFCADGEGSQTGKIEGAEKSPLNPLEDLDDRSLHHWAQQVQSAGRHEPAIAPLEAAMADWAAGGDRSRAGWAAVLLAQIRMEWRDGALAMGWYHKARRLLESEPPGRAQAYLDYLGMRFAVAENDYETALRLSEKVRAAGERMKDADLEGLGLLSVGEANLFLGRVREGLAALDEAGIAASAGRLSPWAGGLVYCGLIYMCMTRADWRRATEWTDQFSRWGGDKGVTAYPGLCRLHRAELLTVRGRLDDAELEIREAIAMLAAQAPWLEGEGWRCLGENLLAKGDLAAARQAWTRATEMGWDAQLEFAQAWLAEGGFEAAIQRLERAFAEKAFSCSARRGRALICWIVLAARAGRPALAASALEEAARHPALLDTPALQAHFTAAKAEQAEAEGRRPEAIALFRASLRQWLEMAAPLPAAQTRVRLGQLLKAGGDAELASIELRAAEAAFRQAGAEAAWHLAVKFPGPVRSPA